VKEEDRVNELRKEEAAKSMQKSIVSVDSMDEIVQIKKQEESPKEVELDEEKLIKDFVSEREMFISRHK